MSGLLDFLMVGAGMEPVPEAHNNAGGHAGKFGSTLSGEYFERRKQRFTREKKAQRLARRLNRA